MPKPKLIALPMSPWSEKARWALDHHEIGYIEIEYVPMLGAPWLRMVTKTFSGKVTVPVLATPHGVLKDSFTIARHADRVGRKPTLFPREHEAEIEAWNRESEAIIGAQRTLLIERTRRSPDAQAEALPAFVPDLARSTLRPLTRMAASYMARKYDADRDVIDRAQSSLDAGLEKLRAALSNGREYLVGNDFTYADITMATTLQAVVPPPGFRGRGAASRAVWTDDARRERFADLVAWRDRIYARHRNLRGA